MLCADVGAHSLIGHVDLLYPSQLAHIVNCYMGVENIEQKIIDSLNNMIADVKAKHPRMVGSLEVKEFNLGDSLPIIKNVTMEKVRPSSFWSLLRPC